MSLSLLNENTVRACCAVNDWEEALRLGVGLLYKNGFVEERYMAAVRASFDKFGSYMVIAKGIVLLHARPEDGVLCTGLSLVTLAKGVNFGHAENDPVWLVLSLAAADNNGHIELLQSLMELLQNTEDIRVLSNAKTQAEILKILQKYY